MTVNLLIPILAIGAIAIVPLALLGVGVWRLRSYPLSRPKKTLWVGVCFVAFLPLAGITFSLVQFAVANFPFTSGVIAHTSLPTGEEVCVVQTFKGAEPYQVSLYARRPGQPWVWHYLAHQDDRWRGCHIDFSDGQIRVYTGSNLRDSLSVAEAFTLTGDPRKQLPPAYTPEQILAQHNAKYRRLLD
jgi:hypothetical protein